MFKPIFTGLICMFAATSCFAQFPSASPEHAVLKHEEGTWDATVKVWANGPDAEPITSKATETNRMIGEMWLISEFKGTFGDQAFTGHGMFGYDPEKKKYVASWIDSMLPSIAMLEGEYDESKKTMTYLMDGKGMDGKPQKSKLVTVQPDKNTRTMTMLSEVEGEFVKTMEIAYTRKK